MSPTRRFLALACSQGRLGAALVLGCLGLASVAQAQGDFFRHFFDHEVEVITVTDMTDRGRLLRRPAPAQPVYYEALVLGYTDFGQSIGGLKPPNKTAMLKLILKVLADQGYHPAGPGHPPEVLLTFAWGTMNWKPGMALLFMGGDKLDIMWELEPLSVNTAPQALTRFRQSPVASLVKESAYGPLYVMSIQAFDRAAAVEGKTLALWHTKISCPAEGLDIAPALQQMIRRAGPYLGREMKKPVWETAPQRVGRVDMGELKVLETIDPNKLPITDMDQGPGAVGPEATRKPEREKK